VQCSTDRADRPFLHACSVLCDLWLCDLFAHVCDCSCCVRVRVMRVVFAYVIMYVVCKPDVCTCTRFALTNASFHAWRHHGITLSALLPVFLPLQLQSPPVKSLVLGQVKDRSRISSDYSLWSSQRPESSGLASSPSSVCMYVFLIFSILFLPPSLFAWRMVLAVMYMCITCHMYIHTYIHTYICTFTYVHTVFYIHSMYIKLS
jgi:hypothetical protein